MSTFIFLDENNILSHASNVTMSSINLSNGGITSDSGSINFNDEKIININSINEFKIGLSAIHNASTLLRNLNELSDGDYLQINESGFVKGVNLKQNKNAILGSNDTSGIIAGTNISKSVDPNNGDITLTSNNATYTVALPLTLSDQKIGLSGLTSYGFNNQILRMNGTNSIEWSNEQDISGFITASSIDTLTNKSMSYDQLTSPPISNDGLSSGHLLINSSGIVNKSANDFTLPTNSGTLALTTDLSNFITSDSLPGLFADPVYASEIKENLELNYVDNINDSDKIISTAAKKVHTSLKARLAFLEGFLRLAILEGLFPTIPYLPLQGNDPDKHFVIQSGSEVLGFRYLQPMDSTTEIGMVYVGSNASTLSSGGIRWTIQYNSTSNEYRFINVENTNIVLGKNNIGSAVRSWTGPNQTGTDSSVYVYHTHLDDQLVTLEATGKPNEFYIYKDVGATPTMVLICYDNNTTNEPLYADEYGTEDPVIWFNKSVEGDFPIYHHVNFEKFIIREYNPNIDP